MTVHHNRFLVNKTNRCTEFQFYWYNYYTCFRQPFCPSSWVLSLWYILCSCDEPFATGSRMGLLVANGSSQLHKMYQRQCTAKNSWWWAERLPKTCTVVIPIILEFSAFVGFIHEEFPMLFQPPNHLIPVIFVEEFKLFTCNFHKWKHTTQYIFLEHCMVTVKWMSGKWFYLCNRCKS